MYALIHRLFACLLSFFVVDGNWTSWSKWHTCSKTCGNGFQKRMRNCTNPAPANGGRPCNGISMETKICTMKPCPGLSCKKPALYVVSSFRKSLLSMNTFSPSYLRVSLSDYNVNDFMFFFSRRRMGFLVGLDSLFTDLWWRISETHA